MEKEICVIVVLQSGKSNTYKATRWEINSTTYILSIYVRDRCIAAFNNGAWKAAHFAEVQTIPKTV